MHSLTLRQAMAEATSCGNMNYNTAKIFLGHNKIARYVCKR